MKPRLFPALLILAAMIAAPGAAYVIRPTARLADIGPHIDLDAMIPKRFGEWRMVEHGTPMLINPQQQAVLSQIYDQTLTRTYEDSKGYRVMLSIAYGGDQRDRMQVHKPEVCYPAQGFAILENKADALKISFGTIPVRRVLAVAGQRAEPITYWTVIADKVVTGGLNKKLVEIRHNLTGTIPDGVLFRVSSIDRDTRGAYSQQDRFVESLLAALPAGQKRRLSGLPAVTSAH